LVLTRVPIRSWEFEREVHGAAMRLTFPERERADLLQVGRLGVMRAMHWLDRRRKYPKKWLHRLAYFSARDAMIDSLRKQHGRHPGSYKRSLRFIAIDESPKEDERSIHPDLLGPRAWRGWR